MKTNELRIGNKVLRGLRGDREVITVTPNDIYELSIYENIAHDFEPIPLTEEWLLKFNSVKDGHQWRVPVGATFIIVRLSVGSAYCEVGGLYIGSLKGVHHLQNIVHALSGKEL